MPNAAQRNRSADGHVREQGPGETPGPAPACLSTVGCLLAAPTQTPVHPRGRCSRTKTVRAPAAWFRLSHPWPYWWSSGFALLIALAPVLGEVTYSDLDLPPHRYFERTPTDRFTQLKTALESGDLQLDRSGEKAFLRSLLQRLEIPESSQMLVFSTTSLQLRFITPENPRALYFNEDAYVGFIPGGRIEVVSLDPELGGIFYIFDIPRGDAPVKVERSQRCMNCHAGEDTAFVPGLVVKSVAPGPTGGSLDSFRRGLTGHGVPLAERFGGWYVTGLGDFTNHWGNAIGIQSAGVLSQQPNLPGTRFSYDRYLTATSDLLPQLLHEHQAGFVNRAVEATYRARTYLHHDGGELTAEHRTQLDEQAGILTRYLLFADEAALPAGGVQGDDAFKEDFLKTRRSVEGDSLKDFDLRTRLFKHRCSYMIYGAAFRGLPPAVKQQVYQRLAAALSETTPDANYAYLPVAEKRAIRRILRGTLTDLPPGW